MRRNLEEVQTEIWLFAAPSVLANGYCSEFIDIGRRWAASRWKMIVTLEIPDHIRFQYVYRMERRTPYEVSLDPSWRFLFLGSVLQGLRSIGAITSYAGKIGAIKSLAKLGTGRRKLYMICHRERAISIGWCVVGMCKYYKIESDAVVIGPIWTSDEFRGQGLAPKALQLAINELIRERRTLFYIDTEKMNLPAQRTFAKCGFGNPVATYIR